MRPDGMPRTVAFYLPQFHAIPENDEWWGEGFTEWTNVRKARPAFTGHDHPRVPTELGYYDLSDPGEVMLRQVEMARSHDVDAFCFYAYWFDGRRLLEGPLDWFAAHCPADFSFCVSWANESWTRRWDGKNSAVLMPQSYADGYAEDLLRDFAAYLTSPRALTVDGRPVFLVHRADQLPDPRAFAATARRAATELGLPGLHLVAAETVRGLDPRTLGFDAVAEFPPVGMNTARSARLAPVHGLRDDFRGRLFDYGKLASRAQGRASERRFVRHPGVCPMWDNTARRGSKATVYLDSSPSRYRRWLVHARDQEGAVRGEAGLVFVNAWNEWAEGAYLEPDQTWGSDYLDATSHVPAERLPASTAPAERPRPLAWSRGQSFSVVMSIAGSALNAVRAIKRVTRRSAQP